MTSAVSTSAMLESDADSFSERLRLKIQPQPPKFPFRDHPFDITVFLVDPTDHLKSGIVVPLNVELYAADKMTPIERQIMHLDPSTKPVMNGDGICKLRIRISECSMALNNRKFVIHVSAATKQEYTVTPAVTTEMTVIQHRLVIQEQLPELWYKDEGGRDKCMTLPIFLVNEKNERVGNRPVPLRVTLLYENEHPVLKQDILKMSPECQRTIDASGKALLKLRIEDVSKNHQGQAFRLKVEADTAQSPMNFDVAFDLSSTISVRSKRNKRRPLKAPMTVTHHIITGPSNPASNTSSPSSNAENDLPMGTFGGGFTADDRRKKMRTDSESPTAMDTGASASPNPLVNTLENVIEWTGMVVHGLQQLEWQTVGYESKGDGNPDPERAIYRCPACWRYKDTMTFNTAQHDAKCLIANLLLRYATNTTGQLNYLLKTLEQLPMLLAAHQPTPKLLGANALQPQQHDSPVGRGSNAGGPSLVSPQRLGNPLGGDDRASQMIPAGVIMTSTMGSTATASQFSMAQSSSNTVPPPLTRGLTDMMNSMDGPPGLFRNTSNGLTEFMRSLDDQEGSDSVFYQNLGQGNQVTDAIELQVYYVLARMITLDSSNAIGFPAFDGSMNLLGFYQEGREATTTEVVFVPVSDIPAISPLEIAQTQRLLRSELKENIAAVYTLLRCNNDIVKLKEDVILFHWNAKDRAAPTW
jgi:hypothetical protein